MNCEVILIHNGFDDRKADIRKFIVIQHVVLFTSVITLAMTGFPLRHAEEYWARPLYNFMGGPEIAPLIHRAAGTVLLALFVYHTIYWLTLFYLWSM